MHTITKKFEFCAAHRLLGLPDGHKCGRIHGHNYTIEVELQSETVDNVGVIRELGDLQPFQRFIDAKFDHQYLNEVVDFNPTSENLARFFFESLSRNGYPETAAVRVFEGPKIMAEYRPPAVEPLPEFTPVAVRAWLNRYSARNNS